MSRCLNNTKASAYLGNTKRRFSKRLSEHVGYIRSKKTEEPSGDHFNLPGHSQSDIQGLGIEHVRSTDPFILRAREAFLIKKFDSYNQELSWAEPRALALPLLAGKFLFVSHWSSKTVFSMPFTFILCCDHDLIKKSKYISI